MCEAYNGMHTMECIQWNAYNGMHSMECIQNEKEKMNGSLFSGMIFYFFEV